MTIPQPLYKEVKSLLIRSLIEGEWKADEVLPSEPRLAARYQVGIATIRAAIGELVAAKFLVRKQGKGTGVSVQLASRGRRTFGTSAGSRVTPPVGCAG